MNRFMQTLEKLESVVEENDFFISEFSAPKNESDKEAILLIGAFHPPVYTKKSASEIKFERSLANVLNAYHKGFGTTLVELPENLYEKYSQDVIKYIVNWSADIEKELKADHKLWNNIINEHLLYILASYTENKNQEYNDSKHYWTLVNAKRKPAENYALSFAGQFIGEISVILESSLINRYDKKGISGRIIRRILRNETKLEVAVLEEMYKTIKDINFRRNEAVSQKLVLEDLEEPLSLVMGELHFRKELPEPIQYFIGDFRPYILLRPKRDLALEALKEWSKL